MIDDWVLRRQREYWAGTGKKVITENEKRAASQAGAFKNGKRCGICRSPIANNNMTGFCSHCQNAPEYREIRKRRLEEQREMEDDE